MILTNLKNPDFLLATVVFLEAKSRLRMEDKFSRDYQHEIILASHERNGACTNGHPDL
jgi:hypothetical protein